MSTYLVTFIDGTAITRFADDEADLKAALVEEFPGRELKSIEKLN
jgi:hypothetical protein